MFKVGDKFKKQGLEFEILCIEEKITVKSKKGLTRKYEKEYLIERFQSGALYMISSTEITPINNEQIEKKSDYYCTSNYNPYEEYDTKHGDW